MSEDSFERRARERERLEAQQGIARERMRTQESIARERGAQSQALQQQRLRVQQESREIQAVARTDAAQIAGQYDVELARLVHEQLPERLAIEHEFAALRSELTKDEMLHEAGVQALFSVAEFAAKAKIGGHFDKERDGRQFAHDVEMERLRQQGVGQGGGNGKPPSEAELEEWLRRTKNKQ